MTPPLVELRGISKTFGGVHAVENVNADLSAGEVVALLGHNGAGKSTLIKVLSGVYPPDHGEIRVAGQPVRIETTRDASSAGATTISSRAGSGVWIAKSASKISCAPPRTIRSLRRKKKFCARGWSKFTLKRGWKFRRSTRRSTNRCAAQKSIASRRAKFFSFF